MGFIALKPESVSNKSQSARDIHVTILYPVGTATMDTPKRKKRQAYLVRYSPTKLLSVSDLNIDRLVAERCDQI